MNDSVTVDPMAKVSVDQLAKLEDYEEGVENNLSRLLQTLPDFDPYSMHPMDVLLVKVKGTGELAPRWCALSMANSQLGACGCCNVGFHGDDVLEVRLVRLHVEDDEP